MNRQDIQFQILKLLIQDKWQLVQTHLNAIQKDTNAPKTTPEKIYPLRSLPITINEDFDDSIPEL